jgi:integrase
MSDFNISIQKDTRNIRKKPYLVRWVGEFDPHTGKQKRYCKSFEKRNYAERFVQKKKDEFESGMSRDEVNITLDQLCTKFLSVNQREYTSATIQVYSNTINRLKDYFHPTLPIKHIKQEHAQQFIAQLNCVRKDYVNNKAELSDAARNLQLRNCKRIFTLANEWGYISNNPFKKVKQVKANTQTWHRITVKEFESLLEHTPTLIKKCFYAVQYGCGLRMGEALNLLDENIDFEKGQIHLKNRPATEDMPPFQLKDKEARSISIPNMVMDLLIQLKKERDPDNPFWLLTKERWLNVQRMWQKMRQEGNGRKWENWMLIRNRIRDFHVYCKNAGIKTRERLHLHCLRKGWACNLAENGISPKTLCELGGWSDPSVLNEYYSKATDANKDKAKQVLDELFGG